VYTNYFNHVSARQHTYRHWKDRKMSLKNCAEWTSKLRPCDAETHLVVKVTLKPPARRSFISVHLFCMWTSRTSAGHVVCVADERRLPCALRLHNYKTTHSVRRGRRQILAARGASTTEIARHLCISPVINHRPKSLATCSLLPQLLFLSQSVCVVHGVIAVACDLSIDCI